MFREKTKRTREHGYLRTVGGRGFVYTWGHAVDLELDGVFGGAESENEGGKKGSSMRLAWAACVTARKERSSPQGYVDAWKHSPLMRGRRCLFVKEYGGGGDDFVNEGPC